ncbi:MAG: NUDIX domain-containing protein [Armatimonadota bacterium]|nr:NUDIX domain-containing protein [Armatimonadota bacterium]
MQTIRSQVTGFKITFVGTSIALIAANLDKVPPTLLVVPGFAAIFFDFLMHSYSYSIKRTGFYCRTQLEPILRAEYAFPVEHRLWEEFMATPESGKNVPFWGALGLTILAVSPGIVALFQPFTWWLSLPLLTLFLVLLICDIRTLYWPKPFAATISGLFAPDLARPCVAVFVEKDGKVLFAKRAIEPAKGKWDIPGGFVEPREWAESAAAREVLEETGLNVRVTRYLGSLPDVYGRTGIPTLNFCFVAEVEGGELEPQSDVASLSWFGPDEFPEDMAFAHQRTALRWYMESIGRMAR